MKRPGEKGLFFFYFGSTYSLKKTPFLGILSKEMFKFAFFLISGSDIVQWLIKNLDIEDPGKLCFFIFIVNFNACLFEAFQS